MISAVLWFSGNTLLVLLRLAALSLPTEKAFGGLAGSALLPGVVPLFLALALPVRLYEPVGDGETRPTASQLALVYTLFAWAALIPFHMLPALIIGFPIRDLLVIITVVIPVGSYALVWMDSFLGSRFSQ